jgi:hypothetical protein
MVRPDQGVCGMVSTLRRSYHAVCAMWLAVCCENGKQEAIQVRRATTIRERTGSREHNRSDTNVQDWRLDFVTSVVRDAYRVFGTQSPAASGEPTPGHMMCPWLVHHSSSFHMSFTAGRHTIHAQPQNPRTTHSVVLQGSKHLLVC